MNRVLCLFIIILTFACQNKEEESDISPDSSNFIKGVNISGTIKNRAENDTITTLNIYVSDKLAEKDFVVHKVDIDNKGSFSTTIYINRVQTINLSYKNIDFPLIAGPSDQIELTFNNNYTSKKVLFKDLTISGTSENINSDLFKFLSERKLDISEHYNKIRKIQSQNYKKYHDSLFGSDAKYIDQFLSQNSIDDKLKDWLYVERHYMPVDHLLSFPMYFEMFNPEEESTVTFAEDFYDDLNTLPELESKHLINNNINSIGNYLLFHYLKKIRPASVSMKAKTLDSLAIRQIQSKYKNNPFLVQFTIYDRLSSAFDSKELEILENEFTFLDKLYKGSVFELIIKEKTQLTKNLLESPDLPEKAKLLTFKSNDPKNFLNEIIADAEGKITYIDNWGTWCAPCRSEFEEATPKLKKQFSKNVNFVYICHLSEEKVWKSMISQYNLEGKHYFVTKEQTEALKDVLNIQGYPTYNIIDANGKILHSGFEFRPSKNETSKILKQLIK